MTVFGGYTPSVNKISGANYNAEPDTYSSPALQSSTGISVSSGENAKVGSNKVQASEPDSMPANTVNVPLPGFDDGGNAHWEDHKVSTEGA